MPPSGDGKRSILFVAEAPSEEEDSQGEHFAGKPGQRLRRDLSRLGVDIDECHKTNAIICHPPGGKPQDLHIDSCRPNLLKTIRERKPNVIVLLGASAVKSLVPTEKDDASGSIKKWAGWRIPSREYQAWICPTFHPSFLLREESPVLDRDFFNHLKRAIKLEGRTIPGESLEELKKRVEIIKSPKQGRLRIKDLSKKKGLCAFDYESNRLKPDDPMARIHAVSFSLEGEDTFSTVVDDDYVMPMLSRALQRKGLHMIASNLKNEERWTIAKMGHGVASWYWDTMLAAHVLDNRPGITSLKFQAYVKFGIANYDGVVAQYFESTNAEGFNRIAEIPVNELLTYNGLDSLLEFMLMRVQRKEMGL